MRFGQKRNIQKKKGKLYEQWVKHGDLDPETVPQKESSKDVPVERDVPVEGYVPAGRDAPVDRDILVGREKTKQGPRLLYVLLAVGICLLCIGLILIFT